ncbi:MAG TPA: helix-turn-helix domain-containing protein [Candidatus Absconditabacterales bacterium]|nr:helix-turn-helix domain-containing protein [Candidatus Absconditabacterales bacterium]
MIKMRARLIEDILQKKRKVQEVAELLSVTRKTIHKWKSRYKIHGIGGLIPEKSGPKKGKAWNKTPEEIEVKVANMALRHKMEGPQELKYRLEEEENIIMDQSTVYRILKRRNVRYYKLIKRPKKKPKLYSLGSPGEEIQVDTAYPFGRHRKFVVYDAIDDCTRTVFSKAYESSCIDSTKDFINELIRRMPFSIKSIRTGQGREFSKTITNYLKELNITHIKNEAYHPEHNGKVERYHQTQNKREIRKWPYLISIHEANYMLRQRNSYYNTKRKHNGLGMNRMTPYEKLEFIKKNVTLILQ